MRNVRYVIDPLDTGKKEVYYYADRDLQIGTVLNVYGRSVVLTHCDPFTEQYYRKKVKNSLFILILTHLFCFFFVDNTVWHRRIYSSSNTGSF